MAIGKMLPDQKSGFGMVLILGLISARSNVIPDWANLLFLILCLQRDKQINQSLYADSHLAVV
ncbi:hypothetical protein GCM10007879_15740 [Maritalea porphyrae]|uniref:Uncharacterized protein n=1 Tax=Maritalea porphyrae TaxID=880732 RepID=A0ABQ5UPY3_9HYPH|nr:hypothetical protein GCM10007879_15740 [Maritalea porphyrae]